jgi:hypothetical protein
MITYRKDRETEEWRVIGPATEVTPGVVQVTKKDGTVTRQRVYRVSKPFDKDGVPHVFGYLTEESA